ncbi:uncharacterized protein LOC129900414 [Solanum dulcamara]|uniref:uncharacterized protein LOC129900414 n=1 Tax=Solanum dulcamara TaxID=45834 RepID=UPI0024866E88|nr:uncharacterized protein LOC129900414 [Solanum dulcamara]
MVAYTNLIACRVCGKVFPHALPLLYHFDQVHEREGYMLAIQRNGYSVSRTTHFKLAFKQGHSQFASRVNGRAIFRSMFEGSHSRGNVYTNRELDPVDFTKPLLKKLENSFTFGNVEADVDQTVDLELKL